MSSQLKRFDAYAKTFDDFRVRTTSGGLVTITSTVIIVFLFVLQLQYYLTMDTVQVLFVDTSRQAKMNITIDIQFPVLPCTYLTVDAMDTSGEAQTDITHNIYKTRLGLDGRPIETALVKVSLEPSLKINGTLEETTTTAGCESCYGAESDAHKCCATCDEVKATYRVKGWSFDASESLATLSARHSIFSTRSRRPSVYPRRPNSRPARLEQQRQFQSNE